LRVTDRAIVAEREKAVLGAEKELTDLRTRTAGFPKELETSVARAVKEAAEKLQLEARNKEQLLVKEFEGKQNVLTTRIGSLESVVKEQSEQLTRATKQLELAYQKVQDIAEKAIEGSSHSKALAELQRFMADQSRKPASEKF
jgi:HD-GYP domain-containing protein (c-di-GMP phosphodiesterase class II)